MFSAGFLVCKDTDDFTDEGTTQADLVALASGVPCAEEECCGGGVEQRAHVCGGAVAQRAVLLVFGNRLVVDATGTEVAVEDAVGQFHVAVFYGAIFGLVGDDGAGNLDDCFVAVLAALFNGGFCAVELGLLAVDKDYLPRIAIDVAGFVGEDGLGAVDELGGCYGCVGACGGFEFGDGGDDGAAAELEVIEEIGEGDGVLGLVLGHGCLLICWVHVCFDALDVHVYLYSFKLHRFSEWCARFRHAANSVCHFPLPLCCHVPRFG